MAALVDALPRIIIDLLIFTLIHAADDLSTMPLATTVAQVGEILQFSVEHEYFIQQCSLYSGMIWLSISHFDVMLKGMKNIKRRHLEQYKKLYYFLINMRAMAPHS